MTQQRRQLVASSLAADVDALLVTDPANLRWLSGFTGSSGSLLLPRDGEAVFATDGRYVTQAATEVADLEVVETRSPGQSLASLCPSRGIGRLGVEGEHLSIAAVERLRGLHPVPVLVTTAGVVEGHRVVKDDSELDRLRTAAAMTDAAFDQLLAALREGVTEREVSWLLRSALHDAGAEDLAFDSIVAFGEHSAIPHHSPTDRALRLGDLVKVDFGARYDGYHADMTRTVVLGPAAEWQHELHAVVAGVQRRCLEATVPGAAPERLDALARDLVAAAGHECRHGLGHGVGLQIHEAPFLTPSSAAARLVPGVPVTVEPGVYLPGRGGVRIEDTVVVRAGAPESLTTSPREMIEIT